MINVYPVNVSCKLVHLVQFLIKVSDLSNQEQSSPVKIIAAVAPAFVGQFGPKVTPEKLRAAMKELGFADVLEVAIGADLCAKQEAEDFLKEVPEELPFMATSCCPAWSVMAKKLFRVCKLCIHGINTNDINSKID